MKPIRRPILHVFLILLLLLYVGNKPATSQTVGIQSTLSSIELISGDSITLTFSTDTAADIYFFSAEIVYDPDQLVFVNAEAAGAMLPDGQIVFNQISPGVLGISVTRTDPLLSPSTDDLLQVFFSIKKYPVAGEGGISYSNITFADSQGNDIDFTAPVDAEYSVKKTIVDLSLTIPPSITVTEGESFNATGEIFATGITIDDENTDTLNVWIGVNDEDTDPEGWSEDKWELMTFVDQTGTDYFTYSKDIAYQRPVGLYYVALRGEIVNSGNYTFGGIGGVWNSSSNQSAIFDIQQQGQYQYTVAEWNFTYDEYTPNRAIYLNQISQLELKGASLNGFTSSAANSNGWNTFAEGVNYWQIVINTTGLQDLKLSSDQSGGSSTGPKDFKVQHSLDGSTWTDLSGGLIEVGNSTQETVDQLPLPESLEDQPTVYIRWVQDSEIRVDGDTGKDISSGGTSRIDDILITGEAINPVRVDVWPGDTNRDQVVDETDVLQLGSYWLSEGPAAIYPSIQFEPREVEEWIPSFVTDADANGDGRVDQNDLQPVGLHFDESVPDPGTLGGQEEPIAQVELSPLEAGQTADLFLSTTDPVDITGISFRFDVTGLDPQSWTITALEPISWGESWMDKNRILQFTRQKDGIFAGALVHRGFVTPIKTTSLMKISIRANQNWESGQTIRLLKGSVTANGQTTRFKDVELSTNRAVSIDPFLDERPLRTELLPNYPNPFNPVTSIPFILSEPGVAQIEIFDAIGRKVAGIRYDKQAAGSYTYQFDASALSSGVYLYRLTANGVVHSRKMLLLK